MRLRLTKHARDNLEKRKITTEEVMQALDYPAQVAVGATAVEYDAVVEIGPCTSS